MRPAKSALRILGRLLRVALCLPLTLLFSLFLLLVLSWWGQDPLGWLGADGLLLTALAFGGVYGLVGLWGSLLLEGSPKSRGLRRALAGGLVVGVATVSPFFWSVRDVAGVFDRWVFLGPVLVGLHQLLQLSRDPRSPAARHLSAPPLSARSGFRRLRG